jgi:4'-phosphopantetheinyl transferase
MSERISEAAFPLSDGEVHVWRVSLDLPQTLIDSFFESLSDDERKRAGQYHFPKDRRRAIVSRGALREILGNYLGMPAPELRFVYGEFGKPALSLESDNELRFNVSHSADLALVAVSRSRNVGIDIERVRPGVAAEQIAERYFSPRESDALRALPAEERTAAFFRYWTCKEAYAKALGRGLSLPLDRLGISLPANEAAIVVDSGNPEWIAGWTLCELFPADGFTAALAAEGRGWQLCCYDWRKASSPSTSTRRIPFER